MRLWWPKIALLLLLVMIYIGAAGSLWYLVDQGVIEQTRIPGEVVDPRVYIVEQAELDASLNAARSYMHEALIREDGHVYLVVSPNRTSPVNDRATNSEAVSYALLWSALLADKDTFDTTLDYIEEQMIHPTFGYLMWRLNEESQAVGDGEHIATDADLRSIRALFIAREHWPDERYERLIDDLADGIERVAITPHGTMAPYAYISDGIAYTSEETWLSYADFEAYDLLAHRRGEPWESVKQNMKRHSLEAQLPSGFFYTAVTREGQYSNKLDNGSFSVNMFWLIERSAQSNDPELRRAAQEALDVLETRYLQDTELYAHYDRLGNAISPRADAPWVYPLIGRAAIALDNLALANDMVREIIAAQADNGGIYEGGAYSPRVTQFTHQESIITLAMYDEYIREKRIRGELIDPDDVAPVRESFRSRLSACVNGSSSCWDLLPTPP